MVTPDSSPEGSPKSPYLHFGNGEPSHNGNGKPKHIIKPKPRRAMSSFDNLIVLANHQERLEGARKMVWRDKGEPAVELIDLWECIVHAGRGGLRKWLSTALITSKLTSILGSATMGFVIRATLNLVLALVRISKIKRYFDQWIPRYQTPDGWYAGSTG